MLSLLSNRLPRCQCRRWLCGVLLLRSCPIAANLSVFLDSGRQGPQAQRSQLDEALGVFLVVGATIQRDALDGVYTSRWPCLKRRKCSSGASRQIGEVRNECVPGDRSRANVFQYRAGVSYHIRPLGCHTDLG
jgi:hypothetical protein